MTTQFATSIVEHEDSFEAGKEAAKQALSKLKGVQPSLVILFCSTQYDYSSVIRGIQKMVGEKVNLIGCTTAGQFTNDGINQEGVACALIASDAYRFFSGIGTLLKNNPMESLQNAIITFPKKVEGHPHQSAILLVDGLAGKGEETVLAAASLLGPEVKFAGAGAADNLSFKETAVFSNQEALTDAASICLIASRSPVIVSVNHGHHPISPPLRVTKAKENVLYEVEGKPALDVWKNFLRDRLRKEGVDVNSLSLSDWSKIFLKYEAGFMIGTNSDYKIRFPISSQEDGSLNFVSTILEGSVIKIMESDPKDQIESARRSVEMAVKSIPKGTKLAGALIFDCACRKFILKEHFSQVVKAVHQELQTVPFIGCETYGEIAMDKGQWSGFHNGTTVVMLFPS
jgi:methyl-accepting chemotaxis protein